MLSYSRGALLALVVGLAFWFAVVPLRLRGAIVLLGASAGAAAVVGWAFSMTGLSTDELPIEVRADAGHELGALLLLMLVAAARARPRRGLPRRRAPRLAARQADRRPRAARACSPRSR